MEEQIKKMLDIVNKSIDIVDTVEELCAMADRIYDMMTLFDDDEVIKVYLEQMGDYIIDQCALIEYEYNLDEHED